MSSRSRWVWIGLAAATCVAYQLLAHHLIVAADQASVRVGVGILNAGAHATINLFMLWVFGRTLAAGREPLITGFARRIHGTLPPYLETYTRNTTAAWCVFFGAQVAISLALLAWGSLDNWSLFVNVLSFPSVALMFVGEYVYRILRFPDYPHSSIFTGVQAFIARRDGAERGDARPRHP